MSNKNLNQNNYIVNGLKDIIKEYGPNYLKDRPFEVYKELLKLEDSDRKICSAILCALVSDVIDSNNEYKDVNALSKKIQDSCIFNLNISNNLAYIFTELYSEENKKEFLETKDNNLNKFLQSEISLLWDGYSIWHYTGGYIECFYKADILVAPYKKVLKNKNLKELLSNNPYVSTIKIQEHFIEEIRKYLDDDFNDFCTCDKYYEPVVEDYYLQSNLEYWCNKNGFKLLECEGSGYDGGYTPDF